MDVIEYGLGKQQRAEVYINRLLCYFLDPDNPHGMGDDFLQTFLSGLPETAHFDEDTYDLGSVRVNQQVLVENGEDTGYADLVLDIPEEWVLLIELKFSAEETGTKFYAEAPTIGDEQTDQYASSQYYLYLYQHGEPEASSRDFDNWTWQTFVADVLDELIREHAPRYPQRTAVQLHDLRDDLANITNMSDEQTSDEEKVELYLEHVDAIEDVSSTFDDAWESYSEQWDEELATSLAEATAINVHRTDSDEYPQVTVPRANAEDEDWILRANGGDWQHLHRHGWYRHEDTLEPLTTRADDRNDLRIGFYHRMEKHRSDAVQDHQLQFNFRNMGSNPTAFKTIYEEQFNARKADIGRHVADTAGTLTGNKLTMITATYDIPVASYENFFDAYTAALHEAFVDLIVDNPDLIGLLSDTFEDAVEEYSS
ncbi:PD-(D/E)XK nuclease family protein [Haloarcula nitratireducens]|uniref:PD-(D/E)XK nuclease family protein n=1 Tax=Haloarcula nitratireducens TaxID=2487749 RepID=A0AAW4PLA0_9EURY|nr:PD-(D/E)XK nuclease family protein [Halomicroarcula nitratireducens]